MSIGVMLFNPFNGRPRRPEDIHSDPYGTLIWDGSEPIRTHAPAPKLWLWKNFVDGRPEYWAFDNPFPVHLDCGDPQTLGEPCGYAIVKPSRVGRTDVGEAEVLRRIKQAKD